MMQERRVDPFATWERSRSGLYLPPETGRRAPWGPWPLAIDLFCGAGGFSVGVHQAGFRVVAAVDNDPWAVMSYLHNLGTYPVEIHGIEPGDRERLNAVWLKGRKQRDSGLVELPVSGGGWIATDGNGIPGCPHFWFGDIRRLSGKTILDTLGLEAGDIDLVFGGPPCQGFSRGGRRDVMDPRNSLVFEFARLVLEIRPKAMAMENVPDIVNMRTPEGLPVLEALALVLSDGGFNAHDALCRTLRETAGVGVALGRRKSSDSDPKARGDSRPTRTPPKPDDTGQLALVLEG